VAASKEKGRQFVTSQTPRRLLRALLQRGNDIPHCRRNIALALTVTFGVMRCRFVIVMMDGGGL
jgi:hypothetical protein